jgi:cytochrome c oxidase assembly protein subunit 11
MTAAKPQKPKSTLRRDVTVAAICGAVVALMVGASYAAVPFYPWFCQTPGYGGTTQVSEKAPGEVLARTLAIRFDSNVAPGLPWKFEPEQNEIKVHIGAVTTVHYKVTNYAAREITAQAGYNVSPPQVGAYFAKINCFCFTQQTMKPGETREMTVVFYVDPSLVKDHDQDGLNTITLSYTFYRIPNPEKPVAEVPTANPTSKKL